MKAKKFGNKLFNAIPGALYGNMPTEHDGYLAPISKLTYEPLRGAGYRGPNGNVCVEPDKLDAALRFLQSRGFTITDVQNEKYGDTSKLIFFTASQR